MANQEITFIVEHEVLPDRSAEFDELVPLLTQAANDDPGTVEYRWYTGSTPTKRCLFERYRDSEATIKHIEAFGQDLTMRYMKVVDVKSVIMFGPASDQLAAQLAPFFDGSVPGVTSIWYQDV